MSTQLIFNIVIGHNAAFKLGLHCFLIQKPSAERIKFYLEIITFVNYLLLKSYNNCPIDLPVRRIRPLAYCLYF